MIYNLLLVVALFSTVGMTYYLGFLAGRDSIEDQRTRGCMTAMEREALGRCVRRHEALDSERDRLA